MEMTHINDCVDLHNPCQSCHSHGGWTSQRSVMFKLLSPVAGIVRSPSFTGTRRLRQPKHRQQRMQPGGQEMGIRQALWQNLHRSHHQHKYKGDIIGATNRIEAFASDVFVTPGWQNVGRRG